MSGEWFIFGEFSGALKQLDHLSDQLGDFSDTSKFLTQFLRKSAAAAKAVILKNFEKQQDPNGDQWADYVRPKDQAKGRSALLGGKSGSIYKSIKVRILRDGFLILSEGEGADHVMFHQHGTRWMAQRRIFPAWSDDSDPDQDADSSELELLLNTAFAKACQEMGIEWVENETAFEFGAGSGVSVGKSTGGKKDSMSALDRELASEFPELFKKGRK